MEYVNRRGQTYYAYQGATKTGKPKYFASKKPSSDRASRCDALPAGYEFFENPVNATVVVRRRKESNLTIAERNLLSRLALELCSVRCEVTIDGNSLTLYAGPAPRLNPAMEAQMPGLAKRIAEQANLEPTFRFNLADSDRRTFTLERYCYRSAIDGWLDLMCKPAGLESLARVYFRHAGKESFYELI